MNMIRRIKKSGAAFLALALVLSGMAFSHADAALSIETNRKCSITIEVDGDLEGEFAELAKVDIPVKVYQVATVSESGKYTALEGYEALGLEDVTPDTTAAEWEAKAAEAARIVEEKQLPATAEGLVQNGRGTIQNLSTGMYLVAAQEVRTEEHAYRFTPYLLSLPNRYPDADGNDEWVYDVTAGLKPGVEDLFGKLIIDKTLTSFNETLGDATFVFRIEGVKDGKKVYSDVVSIVFDSAGTKSVVIDNIPVGTEVTVTEIYSGASYRLTSPESQTVVIQPSGEGEDAAVHVSFTNEYDERLNGGASVVNHFVNDEGNWTVEQQPDSTKPEE